MGNIEIIMLSIGLAADAFSVAICKGISMNKLNFRYAFLIAFMFGLFQAIMPFIGYHIGINIGTILSNCSHLVAFSLLAIIGIKMIVESLKEHAEEEDEQEKLSLRELLIISVATSIDALTVGIIFAAQNCNIIKVVSYIGTITCIISFLGVLLGIKFGKKFGNKAETGGGIILIAIGLKTLLK